MFIGLRHIQRATRLSRFAGLPRAQYFQSAGSRSFSATAHYHQTTWRVGLAACVAFAALAGSSTILLESEQNVDDHYSMGEPMHLVCKQN